MQLAKLFFIIIFYLINFISMKTVDKVIQVDNKNIQNIEPLMILRKNAEIRSKAKSFVFETINQNYMYISLLCSTYLFILFIFLISCVWNYWEFLFLD
jgi:hypothetical protein